MEESYFNSLNKPLRHYSFSLWQDAFGSLFGELPSLQRHRSDPVLFLAPLPAASLEIRGRLGVTPGSAAKAARDPRRNKLGLLFWKQPVRLRSNTAVHRFTDSELLVNFGCGHSEAASFTALRLPLLIAAGSLPLRKKLNVATMPPSLLPRIPAPPRYQGLVPTVSDFEDSTRTR